ncbi:MAG: DUF881 domain-containing protein [Nocardioidaceae bacterium]
MQHHPHKASSPPDWRSRGRLWRSVTGQHKSSAGWRFSTLIAAGFAGLLAITSAINARGTDLRGDRHTDLIGLVSEQRDRVESMRARVEALQSDVETLSADIGGAKVDDVQDKLAKLEATAGVTELHGSGLVVTLDDAPRDSFALGGLDPNLLVVHQQDIQAVVNALWLGGAEGLSLQGQRIISTTGVKCVGNTVVLQGVPYSPPYRVVAVGDPVRMYDAVSESPEVQRYREYEAEPYNLGWSLRRAKQATVPAYASALDLSYAQPASPGRRPG